MRRAAGLLHVEHMQLQTDAGPQGWMPLSIIKEQQRLSALPTVIFLHATGGLLLRAGSAIHARHGPPWGSTQRHVVSQAPARRR